MASGRRKLLISLAALAIAGSGYFTYTLFAAQAQNTPLAQAPLNTQVQVAPAFIMAMDDSRSMGYQSVFPTRDTQNIAGGGGGACWSSDSNTYNDKSWSFFSGPDELRLDRVGSRGTCAYFYYITGTRDLNNNGIPPIDAFGFARSHVYSYNYFDPDAEYLPWARGDGTTYPNASPTGARLQPHADTNIDLTDEVTERSTQSSFTIYRGMHLPQGMKYYGQSNCGLSSSVSNSSSPNGWRVLRNDLVASCNSSATAYIAYFPATFYLPVDYPAPAGFIEGNRTLATNACSFTAATGADRCDMYRYEIRPGNYVGGASGDAYQSAIQNFANWFTYYSTRQKAAIAAASHALADVNNMRVGYFTINNRNNVTMYDMAVPANKRQLFGIGSSAPGTTPSTPGSSTLLGLPANGNSTPNTSAVNFLGQQFNRNTATGGAPIQLACQKNAGMLFTDGFNNDGSSPSASSISGLGAPFDTTGANTMAAIASRYYFNSSGGRNTVGPPGTPPLRGGDFTAGQVPVPQACSTLSPDSTEWKRLDCQSNLHMNLYAITLGVSGVAFDASAEPKQDPFVINPAWPATRPSNNTAATVDDLWHATVNTRGSFINANTPAEITAAMRRILAEVSSGESPSGSVAITGSRIGAGSLVVTPSYDVGNEGTDWSSELIAEQVRLNPTTRLPETELAWRASQRFPAPASRDVYYGKGNSVARFNATNVAFSDLCSVSGCVGEITGLGGTLSQVVNYLLGDAGLEVRNGGRFRDRSTRLGDIVNSNPVVSSPTDDYGYTWLPGALGSSYRDYLDSKAGRRYMVYVGANDGMLHAFDGGLTKAMVEAGTAPDSSGGREEFAYIPTTALGHMANLLFPYDPADVNDQKFQHRYYVDGPVTVSDAFYDDSWSTVLVGTAGAGGRSVFALDVSNPASFGASDRLWEISNLNTSLHEDVRNDIGHVLGKPVIVPVKTTDGSVSWKAIFGNGYESASGRAVLFLVDIDTGAPRITRVVAQEASPGLSVNSRNGLGNIVVVDRWGGDDLNWPARDGFADTVYAADRQGALWKFDIRSATPANVSVPLFRTQEHTENPGSHRYRQPILGGLTAATGPDGGVMIHFGTGSFSFMGDPADTRAQSLYAINDTERGATTATIALSSLVRYTVTTVAGTNRAVTQQTSPTARKGWYVDLPAGERFVGNPEIATGIVFMPTYRPDPETDGCSAGGQNSLFGLNARTGSGALSAVRFGGYTGASPPTSTASVALETGGTAPVKDVGVMAVPRLSPAAPADPANPGVAPSPPEQGCWMMVTVAGADPMYLPYPCGRQSWRQIQ